MAQFDNYAGWKAEEAADRLGTTNRSQANDPDLSLQESFLATPELNDTLTKAVKNYTIPNKLQSLLDDEVARTAEQVIKDLPQGQFEGLIQATMKEMHSPSAHGKK